MKNDMTDIGGEASEKMVGVPCFHGFLFQMSPKFLLVDSSGKNFNGFHILHTSSSAGRPTTPSLWGCFGFEGVARIADLPMVTMVTIP